MAAGTQKVVHGKLNRLKETIILQKEAQGANASAANPVPPMAQQAPIEAPVPPAPGAAGASDDLPF